MIQVPNVYHLDIFYVDVFAARTYCHEYRLNHEQRPYISVIDTILGICCTDWQCNVYINLITELLSICSHGQAPRDQYRKRTRYYKIQESMRKIHHGWQICHIDMKLKPVQTNCRLEVLCGHYAANLMISWPKGWSYSWFEYCLLKRICWHGKGCLIQGVTKDNVFSHIHVRGAHCLQLLIMTCIVTKACTHITRL